MIRLLRDFRLIPVVLVAISALFVLKSSGLIFDGGYTLDDLAQRRRWRHHRHGSAAPEAAPAAPADHGAAAAAAAGAAILGAADVQLSRTSPARSREPPRPSRSRKAKAKPNAQGAAADARPGR